MEYHSVKQNKNYVCTYHLDKSQEDHAKEKSPYIKDTYCMTRQIKFLKKFK